MKMKNIGSITLVGAGPGDPDLITLKGVKALNKAEVVLYDALSNPELLSYARDAEHIFVGKRPDVHRYKQEDINLLLVQKALAGKNVVRLKGGDPFIFGRGHEEIEYAKCFNIDTFIVPGISSCISVPELQEVPLTRRGVCENFFVLTATTREAAFSKDIAVAATSTATVVILMGMKKLPLIVEEFLKNDRDKTPVMIVQNGSLPNEKFVLGTIDTILEDVENAGLSSPAIITIGEVVRLHPELNLEYISTNLIGQEEITNDRR